MPAIANIVINDGATVPVAHTFTPVQSGQNSIYRDTIAGLPVFGQASIRLLTKLDSGTGLNKVKMVLDVPVMESVVGANGAGYTAAPRVAFSAKVNLDFILPSRSSVQNRKDLRSLLINALSNAQLVDAIDAIAPPF